MTARDWVIDKLLKERSQRRDQAPWNVGATADYGFIVQRPGMPDAHVYCPEGVTGVFTIPDLDESVSAFPSAQFIVVFRSGAANDVYPYAEQRGIAVGRLGELRSALEHSRDISDFVSRERIYIAKRLDTNRGVNTWQRVGENAYRITRLALTPATLTIAMFDQYEATADQIYSLLDQYSDLGLDAIVATNPSTSDLAPPAIEAARNAHVKLMTMKNFPAELAQPWPTQ